MAENSELRWQCRRGMRELDVLLERYLDNCYGAASAEEKSAFSELLSLQDPALGAYLLLDERHPDAVTRRVVADILGGTAD